MKHGSLFTGGGGIDLAFERAGMEHAWQSEIGKYQLRVLTRRFPDVVRMGDITEVDVEQIPTVDVLHGGTPCQDLSVAGTRAGLAGKRSGLFWEYVRVAAALRPRWLVWENVPGALSSPGAAHGDPGADLAVVIGAVAELGYGWAYRVLDAQYFGLPQRRPRIILVGCLGDARRAAEVLLEPESGGGHLAPGGAPRKDIAAHAGACATGGCRFDLDNDTYVIDNAQGEPNVSEDGVAYALQANGPAYTLDTTGAQGVVYRKAQRPHDHDDGERWEQTDVADTLNPYDSGDVRTSMAVVMRNREGKEGGGKGPLVSVDQSLTLATGNDQILFTGGMAVRRLTPLEYERCQGFPDGWSCTCGTTETMLAELGVAEDVWRATDYRTIRLEGHSVRCTCPDGRRYETLGNAVAVPVFQWVAERIVAQEQREVQ